MTESTQTSSLLTRIPLGALVKRNTGARRRANEVKVYRDVNEVYGGSFTIVTEPDVRVIEVLDAEILDFCSMLEKVSEMRRPEASCKTEFLGALLLKRERAPKNDPDRRYSLSVGSWKERSWIWLYRDVPEEIAASIRSQLDFEKAMLEHPNVSTS